MSTVAQRMTLNREHRKHHGGLIPRNYSPLTPIIQRYNSSKGDEVRVHLALFPHPSIFFVTASLPPPAHPFSLHSHPTSIPPPSIPPFYFPPTLSYLLPPYLPPTFTPPYLSTYLLSPSFLHPLT